jgi:hypothetical protein
LFEVAHDENRIENGRGSGDIIHAEGVGAVVIIRAEGA